MRVGWDLSIFHFNGGRVNTRCWHSVWYVVLKSSVENESCCLCLSNELALSHTFSVRRRLLAML